MIVLERGDIIMMDFNAGQSGKEINKMRPCLVVTRSAYNKKSAIILCCPITHTVRHHPFEVMLPHSCKTKGVILVNHIRGFDASCRNIKRIESVSIDTIEHVIAKLKCLLS